ncbi:flavin-containing monooxygenase [Pseudomaricurvus hydrocarbonicus]|nr:NAD(P)/FAD-dependent oxidoreductase [Aestuariicella hydrocarbonica]
MVTNNSSHQVIILGAGTSGLSLAYQLLQQGVQPLLLDEASVVASSWRKRHPQLSLNTHRLLSGLPGMPLEKSLGAFVTRDDYIAYLEAYATHLRHRYQLKIRFQTHAIKVEPWKTGWQVISHQGYFRSKQLVVATGTDRIPYWPRWPGLDHFLRSGPPSNRMVHAAGFGHVEEYDDKAILIVGGANSGIDIANHLIQRGRFKSLTISMRHGAHLLPTRIAGFPVQLISPMLNKLPLWLQDQLTHGLSRLCFGDLRPYGIRTPTTGLATRLAMDGVAPGFDQGLVKALKSRRIEVVPDIDRLSSDSVIFNNGQQKCVDSIICATGYRNGLRHLLPQACIGPDNTCHELPGLWIFGMNPKLEGNVYARCREAEQLAKEIYRELSQ